MEQKLDLIIKLIKEQGVNLNSKIDGVAESLNSKIDRVEEKLNSKIDGVAESLNSKIDGVEESLNSKINSLREEMNGLKGTVSRIEEKLDNLSNQVTILEDYAHDKCEAALDGWTSHLQIQEEIKSNVTNLNSKTENHEIRISVLEDALEA